MDELIVENVRCFGERQALSIRPLTLLVGENSSGKSTFLALVRLAQALGRTVGTPDFNEKPFLLGAYDQIAHYHGGQAKRAKSFVIGARFGAGETVTGTFEQRSAQPALRHWCLKARGVTIEIKAVTGDQYEIVTPEDSPKAPLSVPVGSGFSIQLLPHVLRDTAGGQQVTSALHRLWQQTQHVPSASAPIRSKPLRTDDPVQEAPDPEGAHLPMLLARLKSEGKGWDDLKAELVSFGQSSGLLEDLDVKRKFDEKASDPFQLRITVGKFPHNLIDVGYGVNQLLPLLVDGLRASPGALFLMQQPEVHLHPRAQAALGSFMGGLASKKGLRFVVETHSDYLLDRVRMDVRDGKLPSDRVQILFFERSGNDVTVYPITIDARGDLEGAPASYREFFLEEQSRFLLGPGNA